jgi:hypothetical protein
MLISSAIHFDLFLRKMSTLHGSSLTSLQIQLFQENYIAGHDILLDPIKNIEDLPLVEGDVYGSINRCCYGDQCFNVYSCDSTDKKIVQPIS